MLAESKSCDTLASTVRLLLVTVDWLSEDGEAGVASGGVVCCVDALVRMLASSGSFQKKKEERKNGLKRKDCLLAQCRIDG